MTERKSPSRHLSFSQRNGYAPLPNAMHLEELSSELRIALCNKVHELLKTSTQRLYLVPPLRSYVERVLGNYFQVPRRTVPTKFNRVIENFEEIFINHGFNNVLDLCEIMINEIDNRIDEKFQFSNSIKELFVSYQAAYWLETSQRPYQFIPCAIPEQGAATQEAIKTLLDGGMEGAATHLREAAEHINIGQYADSVKDSILAVESVARKIDPEANTKLTPALKSLERAGILAHPALKAGFEKLYGYTSDEGGIRHAIVFSKNAEVGQVEATYMFGSCASFAAYLVHKNRILQG